LTVPLRIVLSADTETPVSAFLKISRGARQAFLLESVEGGERVGRWSFIGARPRAVHRFRVGGAACPFRFLEQMVAAHQAVRPSGFPPFCGGAVGFLSFDTVHRLEPRVALSKPDELGFPEAVFLDVDTLVAFDNARREMQLITQVRPSDDAPVPVLLARAQARLRALSRTLRQPLRAPAVATRPIPALKPRMPKRRFLEAVRRAKEYVAAGDCQQIVLSQRFDAQTSIPSTDLYRALRRVNPSPFMYFFRDGARELIGASPERLVKVEGDRVSVRPIAGTRARGETPEADARLEAELLADGKENAEHVMLVDLGRNDVGRVARYGSVAVDAFRTVEKYSHVLHLVSQVSGRLATGKTSIDALKAAFPAGTLSGAPKVRAMQLIDALEPARRGPYGGAIGYVDSTGDLDLAIAIRTFMRNGSRLSVQAGAGVVYDSIPEAEYQETLNKARAQLRAVQLAATGELP
jgi:anthranilate synthase component 1